MNQLANRLSETLHAAQGLPLLWSWLVTMATDPFARMLLLDLAWRLAVALAVGFAAMLVHRPGAAPAAARGLPPPDPPAARRCPAPARGGPAGGPAGGRAGIRRGARGARRNRAPAPHRSDAVRLLRRVPLVLAEVALYLLPGPRLRRGRPRDRRQRAGRHPPDPPGAAGGDRQLRAVRPRAAPGARAAGAAAPPAAPAAGARRHRDLRPALDPAPAGGRRGRLRRRRGGAAARPVAGRASRGAEGHRAGAARLPRHHRRAEAPRGARLDPRAGRGAAACWPALRNRLAAIWHWIALFYLAALWLVWAAALPTGAEHLSRVAADRRGGGAAGARRHPGRHRGAGPPGPRRRPGWRPRIPASTAGCRSITRSCAPPCGCGLYLLALLVFLQLLGFGAFQWLVASPLGQRMAGSLVTLVVTVLAALVVWETANTAIERHLARLTRQAQIARIARLRTLLPILRTTLLVAVLTVTGLMVLSEIGVNTAPLLASAGIVGVAIGFGSQKLVQRPDHRAVPAAGEHHAGRRRGQPGRPVRRDRGAVGAHHPAARRGRLSARDPVQLGHHRHQHDARLRPGGDSGQRRPQGERRPRDRGAARHRDGDARPIPSSRRSFWATSRSMASTSSPLRR